MSRAAPARPSQHRGIAGFTLIEVLVAFVICSLALGAVLRSFSSGLRGSELTDAYTTATLLAESKLAESVIAEPIVEGEASGCFDEKFCWRRRMERHAEVGVDFGPTGLQVYQLTVSVDWGVTQAKRSLSLTTLRLAKPEG